MRKFETQLQEIKHKVFTKVAKALFDNNIQERIHEIPKEISPGPKPNFRCCIYMEREILSHRIKLALGGNKSNPNVVEVISMACDQCPIGGYEVEASCRGCLAHACFEACPKNAIIFDENKRAKIDKTKCIECGLCAKACPYNAIYNYRRPCQRACPTKAIVMDENRAALIESNKCIDCGACVYKCPFGAIGEKSNFIEVIDILKKSENNTKYQTYAVIAPSIAAQYEKPITYKHVVTGLKQLGFAQIIEAALGADIVANLETEELYQKKFLTSSCCPSFVKLVENNYPNLKDKISHNLSPMATVAKKIKQSKPNAKIIFIGPCIAKKVEAKKPQVCKYVDSVLTFEEMDAMFDAKNIELANLKETPTDDATYFGRVFARCGGLKEAIEQSLKEKKYDDFNLKAVVCDGSEECKKTLQNIADGAKDFNFIEGMICKNGCVGGPCALKHKLSAKVDIDSYGKSAKIDSITENIKKQDFKN